ALEQLAPLGVGLRTTADGLVVRGGGGRPLRAGRVTSAGDHRIAMAFAVAGLVADGGVEIADPGCVAVSFPGFFERLAALGGTGRAGSRRAWRPGRSCARGSFRSSERSPGRAAS